MSIEELKNVEFHILCILDQFCKKNKILYSLYGGTLLGAVRHKGFIPWDDDIDVAMTRTEFSRFCRIWNRHPIEGYYLEYFEYDQHAYNSHAKLRKDGTTLLMKGEDESVGHHGIWVDIFILDKISLNRTVSRKTLYAGIQMLFLIKANVHVFGETFYKRIVRNIIRFIPEMLRQNRMRQIAVYLRRNDKTIISDYEFCDMCTLPYLRIRYPGYTADHYTTLTFCDKEFPVFSNYHELLTIMYGDYMKLPPEKDRVGTHATMKVVV